MNKQNPKKQNSFSDYLFISAYRLGFNGLLININHFLTNSFSKLDSRARFLCQNKAVGIINDNNSFNNKVYSSITLSIKTFFYHCYQIPYNSVKVLNIFKNHDIIKII